MAADSKISRSTIVVVLGIAATAVWLGFTFWHAWTIGHINPGQICLVHIGHAEQTMPTVCVMADTRNPTQSGAIQIILSPDHLFQFNKSIDEHMHEQPPSGSAFGAYEIHDSMHLKRNGRRLSNEAMRAVVRQLMGLTESRTKSIEMDQLAGVLMALELNSAER